MSKLLRKQGGFTLLELLIVIVIIGILAVLIIPNLAAGPQKARDAQRKSDLRNIKTSLEEFYNDSNGYPAATSELGAGANPYMKNVPVDPKGGAAYTYTQAGCAGSPSVCTSYTLDATLENGRDSQINNGTNGYRVTSAN